MAEADRGYERQRQARVRKHQGATKDASAGGALVVADSDPEHQNPMDLDIGGIADISSHVVEIIDDGFAVAFELDEDDEQRLVKEIQETRDAIQWEEE